MAPPVGGYYAWYDASQISGVADGTVLTGINIAVPIIALGPLATAVTSSTHAGGGTLTFLSVTTI